MLCVCLDSEKYYCVFITSDLTFFFYSTDLKQMNYICYVSIFKTACSLKTDIAEFGFHKQLALCMVRLTKNKWTPAANWLSSRQG